MEDIMARADAAMYENKRRKKSNSQVWQSESRISTMAVA